MEKYTILECKREEVEKKLKRYQKKADKYGVPFVVSFSEPYAIEIEHKIDGVSHTDKYEVFDLEMETETIIKDGYSILARIEHSPAGNVVDTFGVELQKKWITLDPFCEHCNSNHNLKHTFIVDNGKEQIQVGRTCLKDYCGIDPQRVGMLNEFVDDIDEFTVGKFSFGDGIPCVYDTIEVLAFAVETIREQGYVRSDERESNKSKIIKKIPCGHPSKEDMEEAIRIAKVIANMSADEAFEAKLSNVQTRINGLYCKDSDFGYIAYAPVALERYEKRIAEMKRRAEEKDAMGKMSEYVGVIGERTDFNVKEAKLLTSYETNYGISFLYRFIDENDNVLIWFASTTIEDEGVSRIKATIKAHNERDGVKQTIISRVKVLDKISKTA